MWQRTREIIRTEALRDCEREIMCAVIDFAAPQASDVDYGLHLVRLAKYVLLRVQKPDAVLDNALSARFFGVQPAELSIGVGWSF